MNTQTHHTISKKNVGKFSTQVLRLVLKKTKIQELFAQSIADPRHGRCTYSLSSLVSSGLLLYLFRSDSRHAFHDEAKTFGYFGANVAKIIEAPTIPSQKTIEDLFLQLNPSDCIPLLPHLFQQLLRNKFFRLHPEFMAEGRLTLAIDAFNTHLYHHNSQHPTQSCDACLKRQRGDKVWFLHVDVVLSVIGPHGFQFPLFLYRVKGAPEWGIYSEKKFKQECELTALPRLIQQFRSFFPKLRFLLLGDSLYANTLIMNLADQYHFDYQVIRKEGSLRSFSHDIQQLKQLVPPLQRHFKKGYWQVQQTAHLIEGFSHKGSGFSVLDLQESAAKLPSKRFAKITHRSSHWQWIFNESISPAQTFSKADVGRLRWHQEDGFNTLKNRGFVCTHDMSRAPHSQTIWKTLMLIAFALSNLMVLSRLGYFIRRGMSVRNWIRDLWAEFAKLSPDILSNAPLPKQWRFFFDTS